MEQSHLSNTLWGRIEEWRYSVTHSWPRHSKVASGRLYVPAALVPAKEHPVPTG